MGFLEGDRVVLVKNYPDDNKYLTEGMTGTVISVKSGRYSRRERLPVGVSFDGFSHGHDIRMKLMGTDAANSGWWCPVDYLDHCESKFDAESAAELLRMLF